MGEEHPETSVAKRESISFMAVVVLAICAIIGAVFIFYMIVALKFLFLVRGG